MFVCLFFIQKLKIQEKTNIMKIFLKMPANFQDAVKKKKGETILSQKRIGNNGQHQQNRRLRNYNNFNAISSFLFLRLEKEK